MEVEDDSLSDLSDQSKQLRMNIVEKLSEKIIVTNFLPHQEDLASVLHHPD